MATYKSLETPRDELLHLALEVNNTQREYGDVLCEEDIDSSMKYLQVIIYGVIIVLSSLSSLVLPFIYFSVLPHIEWYDPVIGYESSIVLMACSLLFVGIIFLLKLAIDHHTEVWSKMEKTQARGFKANITQACSDMMDWAHSLKVYCFDKISETWSHTVISAQEEYRECSSVMDRSCLKINMGKYQLCVPILSWWGIKALNVLWFFFFAGLYGVILIFVFAFIIMNS